MPIFLTRIALLCFWGAVLFWLPWQSFSCLRPVDGPALLLLAGLTLLYFLCASGQFDTLDANPSLDSARSLWDRGSFRLDVGKSFDSFEFFYAPARGGGWISKLGLLTALLYVPAISAARFLSRRLCVPVIVAEKFVASFLNVWVTAMTVVMLSAGLEYFMVRAWALGAAIACGVATYLFPYSKSAQREPLQALVLTSISVLALSGNAQSDALAGVWCSLAILTKLALGVPLLPLVAYFIFFHDAVAFTLFALPGVLVWGAFARCYLGSPFKTGYSDQVMRGDKAVWRTPFFTGVWRQLGSLHSGIFWYNPILWLWPLAMLQPGPMTVLEVCWLLTIAFRVLLYAKWWDPTGDCALGPRYLVAVMPLFFLTAASGISFLPVWAIVGLGAFSCVFQWVQVSVKAQQYWTLAQRAQQSLKLPQWVANFLFFFRKLRAQKEIYRLRAFGVATDRSVSLEDVTTLRGFNFWWLHLRKLKINRTTRRFA